MHLVDITMFYAAEGGGVSTYLNAKARWLAQRQVSHTIVSPNVGPDVGADNERGGRQFFGPHSGTHVGSRFSPVSGAAEKSPATPHQFKTCHPRTRHVPGLPVPGLHGYRWPRSIGSSARVLDELAPDLIEAGDAGPGALAALRVARQRGIPAVAFYHSDLPQLVGDRMGRLGDLARRGARHYLRWLYRQFDLVLSPSRLMVQQLADMGVPGAVHQPLGIDLRVFDPARRIDTLRQHLHLPADARLLVYAGRFTAEKKLELLIDAVRKLGRPYHLLLIGGAQSSPQLTPQLQHRLHYPQISRIGFRRDQRALARLLASCDLLVHPGDRETFGLIVLEAMACGIPVVGARGGGVAELVDQDSGILVQPNSVDALCAGIETAYREGLAGRGQAARQRVQQGFDWNCIMPQLMRRYGRLLEAHGRPALAAQPLYVRE